MKGLETQSLTGLKEGTLSLERHRQESLSSVWFGDIKNQHERVNSFLRLASEGLCLINVELSETRTVETGSKSKISGEAGCGSQILPL